MKIYILLFIQGLLKAEGYSECFSSYCACCKSGECIVPGEKECRGCLNGFTNDTCREPCPLNCFNCSQTYFTNDRTCFTCKPGYYNGHQEDNIHLPAINDCSMKCPDNCQLCSSSRNCEQCKDGFFKVGGGCQPCKSNCKTCTSYVNCQECNDRFYLKGKNECYSCLAGCISCNNIRTCNQCEKRYHLSDQTCFPDSRCSSGTFSFNDDCRRCRENCTSCVSETVCTMCKIGHHGETCSLACPKHCHDDECEKASGTCLSCIKGYYSGENKTCIKCPESCATCRSSSYCSACKSGYRGDFCEIACSNCKEGTSCDKNTGYCLDSCTDGLSGDLCDTNCDVKCKSCVRRNNNECTACAFDKHGINCNQTCSSTCVKNECNDSDGVCTSGCLAGYWGPMCENLCSANCKNLNCTRPDGTCLEGCTEGYYEHNCRKEWYSTQRNHFGLVVGVVIGGVSAIIIVVVFTCYFKRARLAQRFKWLPDVVKCHFLCCQCFYKGEPKDEEMEVLNTLNTSSEPTKAVNSLGKNETESLLTSGNSRIENDGNESSAEAEDTLCNNSDVDFESIDEHQTSNEDHKSNTVSFKDVVEEETRNYWIFTSYTTSIKYIVSYGPKKTLLDESFWEKILQSRCEIVVMLSSSQESEDINGNLNFKSDGYCITVRFKQGRNWVNYTMKPVVIKKDYVEHIEKRNVVLLEFFAWPKVDIGDSVGSFLEFHKMVKDIKTKLNGPTLVHCSAGVHRCRTYIAVDMLQKKAKQLNENDIRQCLQHLNKLGLQTTQEQIDIVYRILAYLSKSRN